MIHVRNDRTHYIVEGADDGGRHLLYQPLHRIFFRSNLSGSPADGGRGWKIPLSPQPGVPLQQLIDHLAKYSINYVLDQTCNEVLAEIHNRREEFQCILRDGLEAKKGVQRRSQKDIELKLSEGFTRKLTKLQIAAVNHLLTVRHGANFSVPGSGKTAIALAYYHILRKERKVDAFLVVGPASCFEPWEHEYELCFGSKPKRARLAGNTKTRRRELCLTAERYEFLLTTYYSAAKDVPDLVRTLTRRRYLLILDESHWVFRSNRPPNPEQTGRVIRDKAAGGRSEATLEFFS